MRRLNVRFLIGFFTGSLAAALLVVATAGTGSLASTRYEDLSLFSDVLRLVRENYVEPVDEHKLIQGAVRGMLQELDPHSSYLDPDAHREMQIDTRGEFHGLGIEISKERDGFIIVVSPIEGTPAWRAGIRARDQIVAICPTDPPEDWTEPCHSTKTMDLHQAVRLMRGPKGTEITIRVFREGFERPESFTILRDVVKVASVEGRILEDGYAYARVRSFQERTARDLRRVLGDLREENGEEFHGFVLDLRDNPGGLLDQAIKVADMWIDGGLIVYTQGRVEGQQQEYKARPNGEGDYPLVVLVNAGSASASEIVAGALQDHHRALLLGGATFGKGSVQTVFPLENHSGLRLTTALYFTPSGRSIQEVGIAPDIEVQPPALHVVEQEGGEPRAFREEDLEGHFTQEDALPDSERDSDLEEGAAVDIKSDPQLTRAVEVLKSWTYFDRLRGARAESVQVRSADAAGEAPTP
jgi:carboxyl-terminal processing protease